jgi:hypothetical protein
VEAAWRTACAAWRETPSLSLPEELPPKSASVAYIDLEKRQVFFNAHLLRDKRLQSTLPALFAHELGHHLEYPHTLRLSADLLLMANELFTRFPPVFLNLFYDLLINEAVGRDAQLREQLQALYRGTSDKAPSALFQLYLSIYDALWGTPGHLCPTAPRDVSEKAELFAQTFFSLSSIHDQFAYFCATFAQLIFDAAERQQDTAHGHPLLGDVALPSENDYPADCTPSPAAIKALRRALEDGWLPEDFPGKQSSTAGLQDPLSRLAGLPGTGQREAAERRADRFYASRIEQVLAALQLPPQPNVKDPYLPGPLEDWDVGDDPSEIDWISSLSRRGALAAATPLRRTWDVDDEPGEAPGIPRLELYLDTSGSMADPLHGLNPMTLAAQVLATLAIRRGSQVRACVYSYQNPLRSGWLRSEHAARRFLFQYIGGGTLFPFEVLHDWSRADPGVVRVVISDSDFLHNLAQAPRKQFEQSVLRSRHLVLLLLGVSTEDVERHWKGPLPRGARVVTVAGVDAFASLAARLGDALFPQEVR